MIRYPDDVKAEIAEAIELFRKTAYDTENAMADPDVIDRAIDEFIYEHCSERTKAFLDDTKVIKTYADKHGLKV